MNLSYNDELYERLGTEDKRKIDALMKKARKKPRKKAYDLDLPYHYFDQSFKDYSMDNIHEVIDYYEMLVNLGEKLGISKQKIKSDFIYQYHYHIQSFFEARSEVTSGEKKRWNSLMEKIGVTKAELKAAETDDGFRG